MSPEKEVIFLGASPAVDKLARVAGVDKLFACLAKTCVDIRNYDDKAPLSPNRVSVIADSGNYGLTFLMECTDTTTDGQSTARNLGTYALILRPIEDGATGVFTSDMQCVGRIMQDDPKTIVLPLLATGLPKV